MIDRFRVSVVVAVVVVFYVVQSFDANDRIFRLRVSHFTSEPLVCVPSRV